MPLAKRDTCFWTRVQYHDTSAWCHVKAETLDGREQTFHGRIRIRHATQRPNTKPNPPDADPPDANNQQRHRQMSYVGWIVNNISRQCFL